MKMIEDNFQHIGLFDDRFSPIPILLVGNKNKDESTNVFSTTDFESISKELNATCIIINSLDEKNDLQILNKALLLIKENEFFRQVLIEDCEKLQVLKKKYSKSTNQQIWNLKKKKLKTHGK